jgi:thioredoxin 1
MTRELFIQLLLGLLVGGGLGAVLGYVGRCSTGACPLTANPWRGAFLGAMIGGLFAWSAGGGRAVLQINTAEAFDNQVLHATRPVLVDFYSTSCPPCRKLSPTIERLAEQYSGRALVCKVDVTRLPQLATRYGIQGIPTVLFLKDGQQVHGLVGVHPQEAYAKVLDSLQGRS